jgi:hypothetical protein
VSGVALELVPYALLAALSPLGFAATIAVLEAGRLTALGFAAGVLVGQLLACGILVAIGSVAVTGHSAGYPTVKAVIEITLGVALLVLAVRLWRHPPAVHREQSGRAQAALERLRRVRATTAGFVGLLLGIGGPKRLVLTALASTTIAASGVSGSSQAQLVVWYGILATFLVWAPVGAYVLAGERALGWLDRGGAWASRHQRTVTFWVLVIVGALLLAEGIGHL